LKVGQPKFLLAQISEQKILINWTPCYVAAVMSYDLLAHFDL